LGQSQGVAGRNKSMKNLNDPIMDESATFQLIISRMETIYNNLSTLSSSSSSLSCISLIIIIKIPA
jgi:hypothetical protein